MELGALAQHLKKDGVAPVWVVYGDELWLVEQAIRMIVTAAVGKFDDPMAVTRVDLAEGKKGARDVIAACRSIGLFTSRVAVIARAAEVLDKKAEDKEEIGRYLDAPAAGATLVLRGDLDGRSALVKRAKKHGQVLAYGPLKPKDAVPWMVERARALGSPIDRDAAYRAVELVGTSLLQLEQILNQLGLYVGPGQTIRAADVEGALAATREHTVFELADAIGDKNAREALRHLNAMLEQREQPTGILGMIVRHFRQLLEAKAVLMRGQGPDEIMRKLKLSHPFIAEKLTRQSERFDEATLRSAFEQFFRTELELKSSRGVEPALRLEALLLRLSAQAPAPARAARR
ncbi:MAG: DNA polymerase III subunit delta [Myxococcota bacterium]